MAVETLCQTRKDSIYTLCQGCHAELLQTMYEWKYTMESEQGLCVFADASSNVSTKIC